MEKEIKYEDLIKKLRELCFSRGWTQTRLAKEMGLTVAMTNRLLNGRLSPNQWSLHKFFWVIDQIEKEDK